MKEQHPTRPKSRKTISIIVPVYKTERFLNACIASILAQTFTDFELILVDDGSPDSCPASVSYTHLTLPTITSV